MDSEQLEERWKTEEGANCLRAAVEALRRGDTEWERCLANMPGVADVPSGKDLRFARLRRADLEGANLNRANLELADLSRAILEGANLEGTNLEGANLNCANLMRANLKGADLWGAKLRATNLEGADFSFAKIGYTQIAISDLSTAKGLVDIEHHGPSSIGIDTLYLSGGGIPKEFLRGAGVPTDFIDYALDVARVTAPAERKSASLGSARSTTSSIEYKPVQYYSCFISYSSKDSDFAKKLHTDLKNAGVRCWIASDDMKTGAKLRPGLDDAIRAHDKLMLVLSRESVESDWVEQEVETALARERKEKSIVLFPLRVDDTVMDIDSGWPALVKNTRHIGEFTDWQDDQSYSPAFERLLRDLKAEMK